MRSDSSRLRAVWPRIKERNLGCDERGATAVEFALIAPVLIALTMGIIEFGLMLYTQASAASAARDVTRRIATNRLTVANASTTVVQQLPPWVQPNATVTVTQTTPGTASTNQIAVRVSFPANKATPTNSLNALYGTITLVSRRMQQEA
jgi:Flp pilus assembly protein TadG